MIFVYVQRIDDSHDFPMWTAYCYQQYVSVVFSNTLLCFSLAHALYLNTISFSVNINNVNAILYLYEHAGAAYQSHTRFPNAANFKFPLR